MYKYISKVYIPSLYQSILSGGEFFPDALHVRCILCPLSTTLVPVIDISENNADMLFIRDMDPRLLGNK
jgi:hypothetical protein